MKTRGREDSHPQGEGPQGKPTLICKVLTLFSEPCGARKMQHG